VSAGDVIELKYRMSLRQQESGDERVAYFYASVAAGRVGGGQSGLFQRADGG